jgi:hypothetical protein
MPTLWQMHADEQGRSIVFHPHGTEPSPTWYADQMALTLFLDFDGVLHADPVFMIQGVPTLSPELGTLFEWSPVLEGILSDFPDTKIVLSTSWAAHLGLTESVAWLSAGLQKYVIDVVWDRTGLKDQGIPAYRFHKMARYDQIFQYVKRKGLKQWLAIDNDEFQWPADQPHRLVKTSDTRALGDVAAQSDLRQKLAVGTLLSQVQQVVDRFEIADGFDAQVWATHWIQLPQSAFGGQTPAQMLGDLEGRAKLAQWIAHSAPSDYA